MRITRARALGALVSLALLCGCAPAVALHGTALHGAAPDFTLADGTPTPLRLSALRGETVLLFFGYTHCPDICPTTLSVFATAKRRLGAAGAKVTAVFVSVDPRRDTPARARAYARSFDPAFHGVTGTEAELAPVKAAYHVYSQALPPTAPGLYAVAHSSSLYVIDARGEMRELLPWDVSAENLTADLKALTP